MDARVASLGGEERDLGPDSPEWVRIASIRSFAAEAGLTLGPVTEANIEQAPELAVVESLEGKSIAENEINTKTIAEKQGLDEQAKAFAERIRANRAARTGESDDLRSVGQITGGTNETSASQEKPVRQHRGKLISLLFTRFISGTRIHHFLAQKC